MATSPDFLAVDKTSIRCSFQFNELVYNLATSKCGNDHFVAAAISHYRTTGHPPLVVIDVASAASDEAFANHEPLKHDVKPEYLTSYDAGNETVWDVSLNYDDSLLAAATQRGACVVFNRETKEKLKEFKNDSPVRSCAISPDGRRVVWCDWACSMRFGRVDLPDDVVSTKTLGLIASMNFAADAPGSFLATGHRSVELYRWESLQGHDEPPTVLQKFDFNPSETGDISRDATQVLAFGPVGEVVRPTVVHVEDPSRVVSYIAPPSPTTLSHLAFCMNDSMCLFTQADTAFLGDFRAGAVVRSFKAESDLRSCVGLGSHAVIVGAENGDLSVFDVGMGSMIKSSRKA